MQTLMKVIDPELLTQGLWPSLAPNQVLNRPVGQPAALALWRDGANVRFNQGRAQKSLGYTVEDSTVIPGHDYTINCMAQSYVDEERRIFFATNNGFNSLNLYDDGVYVPLGDGYGDGDWSMITYGTWLIATNNNDAPWIWKDSADAPAPLGGVNFLRCKILRKNNNHIFALNLDTGGQRVQWSAISAPEAWTPLLADDAGDPGNDAGGIDVRDLDSDISACEILGEDLAFYSQNSMGRIVYTGDQFIYSVEVKLTGIGATGPNAVVSTGQMNFGLSRKGVWQTDGLTYTYIDSPAIHDYLNGIIDWQAADTCVSLHNQVTNSVEWHFLCTDNVIRGIAYDYVAGGWTKLFFPITFGLEQQVFDYPTVATGGGFGFYGSGHDQGDAPMTAWIQSVVFDGNAADNYKIWDAIRLDLKSAGAVQIAFGFSDTPKDEDLVWTDWQDITRDNFVPQQYDAPYAAFKVQSTDLSSLWEISGVYVMGEVGAFI